MLAVTILLVLGWYGLRLVWWAVSNWDAELEAARERLGL